MNKTQHLQKNLGDAIESPSARQMRAANPLQNVWVGASAGTGKTKVLIDRVLRLMLPRPDYPRKSATPPAKVLCLTFTKTAAAEMSNRIYQRLSEWAVIAEDKITLELTELLGVPPSPMIVEEARRLFARVLDTPGGPQIMTIHAFCQSVLKRFPLEAGVPPHFELMDEPSAIEYLTKCLHTIIAEAKQNPHSPLAISFCDLALQMDSSDMTALLQQIIAKRSYLAEIFKAHGDVDGVANQTIEAVYRKLDIAISDTEESLLQQAAKINQEHEAQLRHAAEVMLQAKITDQKRGAIIADYLAKRMRQPELFYDYCSAFIGKEGDIYKKLAGLESIAEYPSIIEVLTIEANRVDGYRQKLKALRLAKINASLLNVASAMLGRYAQYKKFRDRLDYDDLIIRVGDLLANKAMVPWVLFKLDSGIDHILVDEAQDTSPLQWRIVEALSAEFAERHGSRDDMIRTLFVVGDEKQSIYSFQGADPHEFERMRGFFENRYRQFQDDAFEVLLEHSFRSSAAVLDVVDHVFAAPEIKKGVVGNADRAVRHLSYRQGQAGLVEVWPLFLTPKEQETTAWQLPLAVDSTAGGAAQLAEAMAKTIAGWLKAGEILKSKNRPIRAGDILILLQSRGAFIQQVVRALKAANVPVAGIDRMRLSDEIAVMDLLALAQFVLQPKDDLVLATLLKSPLIGLSEDDLFKVCYGRKASLWAALQDARPDLALWLSKWLAKVGYATPYEFFSEALSAPAFADTISGRRAFYARLGLDIEDALHEFLNIALQFEQSHTPSLQKFVDWFMRGDTEIKREQDVAGIDAVRIMTVHAAKGLQAPIVFLPDASKLSYDHNKARIRLLWPQDKTDVPLWAPRKEMAVTAYTDVQARATAAQAEEYRRLLYVAMTRAEDRLYIAGYQGGKTVSPDSWYHIVATHFPKDAEKLKSPYHADEEVLMRYQVEQTAATEKGKEHKQKVILNEVKLPDWAFISPAEELGVQQSFAPSKEDEASDVYISPLQAGNADHRFKRGIILHQILQFLPELPMGQWQATVEKFLARATFGLTAQQQKTFTTEILAVVKHPEFSPIFGAGSKAEVPIVGLAGEDKNLSGQMDRIVVTEHEVLVVDYKTNRPPPADVNDVPKLYIKQMAAYAAVMRNIYPKHHIKCALLWTDACRLMPIPDDLLKKYF